MSRAGGLVHEGSECFPRVSGDEPEHTTSFNGSNGFSPRERG